MMQRLALTLLRTLPLVLVIACGRVSKDADGEIPSPDMAAGTAGRAGPASDETGGDTGSGGRGSSMGSEAGTPPGGSSMGESTDEPMPFNQEEVSGRCDDWCAGATEAACTDETLADCEFVCRATTSLVACNALNLELFDCAFGATFTCNQDGDPVPEGCEAEYASAWGCTLSHLDETIEAPCQSLCDAQEANECKRVTPTAKCTYGCQLAGTIPPVCAADWRNFVNCAVERDATFTCDDTGMPSPDSCQYEYQRYFYCLAMPAG